MKSKDVAIAIGLFLALILGCKMSDKTNVNRTTNTNASTSSPSTTSASNDGIITSGTGVEKEKPASDKGNVQGKVFYNSQPVKGVEVKLCEKFSQFVSGCSGETFATRTDDNGEYLLKNVTPRVYEGLLVRVFTTPYFVFATSGIVQTAKYKIVPGATFFAPDTNLFKHDLKLVSPKASSKTGTSNIEVKWDAYPDAAYYKMSIYADTSSGAKPEYDFIGRKVEDTSFTTNKPLEPGTYNIKIEAYNSNDVKLASSADDHKFTVAN